MKTLRKDDLKLHQINANKGTARGRKMLTASLERLGAGRSIVADRDGNIIAGNKTFEAAKDREIIVVPSDGEKLVVVQRTDLDIDSAKAKELAIADNRIGEVDLAWDAEMLGQYTEIDLSEFWSDAELRSLMDLPGIDAPEPRLDEAEALAKKWQTETGQVWLIGPHRLFCGDSTDPEAWTAVLATRRAGMAFTDPPWNVAIGGDSNPRHRQRELLQNDLLSPETFREFLTAFLTNLATHLDGDLYCVLATREWPNLDLAIRATGFHWSTVLVWVKDTFVLGRSKYHHRFEPIWYGWHSKGKSSFCGTRDLDDVWEFPRPFKSEQHPTMKPVDLVAKAIVNSSARGSVVIDPFLGAGSTMVAAHSLQRVCCGIEIEPKYVAVVLERMAEMGLKPRLESGKSGESGESGGRKRKPSEQAQEQVAGKVR